MLKGQIAWKIISCDLKEIKIQNKPFDTSTTKNIQRFDNRCFTFLTLIKVWSTKSSSLTIYKFALLGTF